MARVPYMPVPDITPIGAPAHPFDYMHIEARPEDFGAGIGRALEQGGQQIEEGGAALNRAAIERQNLVNQFQTDNKVNDFQDFGLKLFYGDPTNGQKGLYSLQGKDAMDAYGGIVKSFENQREAIRSTLQNGYQIKEFDSATRRMQSIELSRAAAYVNQQSIKYGTSVNMGTIDVAKRAISSNPSDDAVFSNNLADWHRAVVRNGQINGAPPELTKAKLDEADAEAIGARVDAWSNSNPTAALSFLEANKQHLDGPSYNKRYTSLERIIQTTGLQGNVSDYMSGVNDQYRQPSSTSPQTSAQPTDMLGLVQNLEKSGDAAVSSAGAVGRYQIMPATARQYGFDPAKLTDPAYNQQAATAILNDLSKRYNGDRDAMLVAYNAGPGVADKWIAGGRNNALLPAETKAYLSRANNIAPTTQAAGAGYKPLATYYQENYANIVAGAQKYAAQKYPDNPDLQARLVSGITKNMDLTIKAQGETNKADFAAIKGYIYKNNVTSEAQLQGSPVAENWSRLQADDSESAHGAEKIMAENAKPTKEGGIGTGFYGLLQKVVSGQITKPSDLSTYVGEPSGITTAGDKVLTDVINTAQTPQGRSQLGALANILKWAHGEISKSDPSTGTIDAKGDERFQKYLALAVPTYFADLKNGIPLQDLMDVKGQHSITSLVAQFKASKEEDTANMFSVPEGGGFTSAGVYYGPGEQGAPAGEGVGTAFGKLPPSAPLDVNDPKAIAQAFAHAKITKEQLMQLIGPHPEWWSANAPQQPQSAPLIH